MMKTAAILLLLAALANTLSTYPYTFPTSPTSTYQQPSYLLGYLSKDTTLSITMQLPFGGAILTSSTVLLSIVDSNTRATVVTFDDSSPSKCNGGTACYLSWKVTDGSTYYLKVASVSPNTQLSNIVIYYLFASANNQAILNVADVLRQHIIKYFYIAKPYNLTLTITPNPTPSTYFTLLAMDPSTATNLRVATATDLSPTTIQNGVGTYITELNAGYYAVVVRTDGVAPAITISTQSDAYPCPYSSSFADAYTVFPGCSRPSIISTGSGLPCLVYDYNAQICTACIPGYSLSLGACTISTSCGPREYFSFGRCYPVSASCDQFDPYTGNCYSCLGQLQLISNQCVNNTSYCNPGFFLFNSLCISSTCKTFSPANGNCLTCLTPAYYLSAGKCLPVDCGFNSYYSVRLANCTPIPNTCLNFSIASELCNSCITGFVLVNGQCTQYSNTNNCQLYNFTSATCTLCNSNYYVLNGGCIPTPNCSAGLTLLNGVCVLSPISCSQGQVFINSQCVNLPNNCLALDIFLRCAKCSSTSLLVEGACKACSGPNPNFPCISCPASQYVDGSGVCRPVSPYCSGSNWMG